METDEPPTIGSLPDALLQHALSYLSSDLAALGRMLCTSAALSATAKDDAVWGPLCRSRFGLDGLYGPERESCASYWHAARAWTQLCVQLGGPKLWEQMRMVAAITEGARVTLVGLSRVELNGRCGRALRRLPQEAQAAGRWEIEIDGQPAAVLSIKTENLRLCDTPLVPMLAPLWTRAAGAWRVLAAWAEATLPELHATLAPPADRRLCTPRAAIAESTAASARRARGSVTSSAAEMRLVSSTPRTSNSSSTSWCSQRTFGPSRAMVMNSRRESEPSTYELS